MIALTDLLLGSIPPTQSESIQVRHVVEPRDSLQSRARLGTNQQTMCLFGFYAGVAHDLGPDLNAVLNFRPELLGRAWGRRHAIGLQQLRRLLQCQRLGYLGVEAVDYGTW